MQKAFVTVTLVLVRIAAASVAYYFGRYLPRLHHPELAAQQRKAEFENSQRCYSEGSRAYAEYVTMHAEGRALPGWEIIWDEPETHYDRKTDTCLVQIASVKHLADPS